MPEPAVRFQGVSKSCGGAKVLREIDLEVRAGVLGLAGVKRALLQRKSEDRTVFLTAHSLADIEEICDHMAVLHNGRLAHVGPPSGLLERHGESTLENAFLRCTEDMGECHA